MPQRQHYFDMNTNTRRICAVIIGLALLTAGCSVFHDRPIGSRNQIVIIADNSVWTAVSAPLKRLFEKEVITPQSESTYYLEQADLTALSDISRRPYIIVIAPLHSAEPVSVFLSNSLSPQAADGVDRGEYYVFVKPDLWARDQQVLFLAANDLKTLCERIVEHSAELYALIDDHRNQVEQSEMYARLEQKNLERRFLDAYGWRLRVQHDYLVIIDDPDRNLVQLKRNYPDRWMTVFWIEGDDTCRNLETCAVVRDSLGKQFKDPVFNYPEYLRYNDRDFRGRPGGFLTGLWATESDIGGGPFFTYVVYDSTSNRTYFLDGAVFAPHDLKEPFLRQIKLMAETFVPGKIE